MGTDSGAVARRPPGEAEETFGVASRRVIRFGVGYALVVLAFAGLGLAGYAAIRSGAADPNSVATQASVLLGSTITGLVGFVCVIGLVVSTIVWIVSVHRVRPEGPGVVGYVAMTVCLVLIGSAYVVPAQVATLGGAVATEAAMRIGGIAALIAGVVVVRSRIRRATGLALSGGRRSMKVSSDDWNASKWDPDVIDDIERRRGSQDY